MTSAQLYAAGISSATVARRVKGGQLHRIHRGVYAVGHRGLSAEARWIAAQLACGEGAVVSHRSAAELWGLLPKAGGAVHITVPASSGGRRRRRGLVVHRSSLPAIEVTVCNRIPVTTPARTLADLERVAPADTLRQAIREAEFRGMDLGAIETDGTRSELERSFLRLCRRHGLPMSEVNVRVGRFTLDFLWREQRLAVETDGYDAHRGRQAFEDDRERQLELELRGIRLLRFTHRQITADPARVAAAVRRALDAGR